MRNLLLVTFDLLRAGEAAPSLAVASILAFLRNQTGEDRQQLCDFRSINLLGHQHLPDDELFAKALRNTDFAAFTHIAIGAYVWAEGRVNPLMRWIRARGFRGEFVLGGYQISYTTGSDAEALQALQATYPDAQRFVRGHGESNLQRILSGEAGESRLLGGTTPLEAVPSPYTNGVIFVEQGQSMVRTETQRGCPYTCSFCAHRDMVRHQVHRFQLDRVRGEFGLFATREVGKVNVLDPVFNAGPRAIGVLEIARETRLRALLSLQCRFETLTTHFLDALDGLRVELEFGAQTLQPEEARHIKRPNDLEKIAWAISELNQRKIPFEVSLIYGLPGQTPDSFKASIEWLESRGVTRIKAWPLMLLRGTELERQRDEFGLRESRMGDFGIPVVTESYSYTEAQWEVMRETAEMLCPTERV